MTDPRADAAFDRAIHPRILDGGATRVETDNLAQKDIPSDADVAQPLIPGMEG